MLKKASSPCRVAKRVVSTGAIWRGQGLSTRLPRRCCICCASSSTRGSMSGTTLASSRRWASRAGATSSRLVMGLVMPSGCSMASIMLMGWPGGRSAIQGKRVVASHCAPRFMCSTFHAASITMAGMGSCACSSWARASRTGASTASASSLPRYTGANPACCSATLRSASGACNSCNQLSSSSRLGWARPLSTKLTCRWLTPMRRASSSWLRRLDLRAVCRVVCRLSGGLVVVGSMGPLNHAAARWQLPAT